MGSVAETKPHVVIVPYPSQGHINPMMQLAKLLHSKGFHVTFVNTEFNHNRFIRNKGPDSLKGLPDFRFRTIPDGLPPSDRDATQDLPALCSSIRNTCLASFLELLYELNSTADVPPVTCVVSDGLMGFGVKAARMLGIPDVQLWAASACGFLACLQFPELVGRGIIPFEDEKFLTDGTLDAPVDWALGMRNMRLKDFPGFIRVTDIDDILFNYANTEAQNCLESSAIIFNTFDEFESEVLEMIASKFPNIYTIGPLPLLCRHLHESELMSFRSNLWKEDLECLKWLDKKEPNSVVYVNYGSIAVMTDQQLKEVAWGLANSMYQFLWIVRPDVVKGDSAILSDEFFEEIKGRGMMANWCPQDKVLSHPSISVFLTHCGWNSIIESICGGVPIICWPFFAEQHTNCRYACTTWGIGTEVNQDVKRADIEALVREIMEGDKGKQIRQKTQDWRKKAEAATDVGGASYNNFNRCIKEIMEGDKGKQIRQKTQDWRKKAEAATDVGGASYNNFNRCIKEIMEGDKGKQIRQKTQDWRKKAEAATDVGGASYNNFNRCIKEIMEGDKGKQIRQKTQDWRKKAEAATDVGGASYNNFNRCIKEALHGGH